MLDVFAYSCVGHTCVRFTFFGSRSFKANMMLVIVNAPTYAISKLQNNLLDSLYLAIQRIKAIPSRNQNKTMN